MEQIGRTVHSGMSEVLAKSELSRGIYHRAVFANITRSLLIVDGRGECCWMRYSTLDLFITAFTPFGHNHFRFTRNQAVL